MGKVTAEIELLNADDVALARKHMIGEDEIKRITVPSLVDTGSLYLCINENIQQVLQIPVLELTRVVLANDQPVECKVVGPVVVKFKNRTVHCGSVIVLPGGAEALLGLLPLEEMDVVIDPNRNELIVNPNYPDHPYIRI